MPRLLALALASLLLGAAALPAQTPAPAAKPLRALLITGGCCHNYDLQAKALMDGAKELGAVEWKVVNEGGTGLRARIPGLEVCGKTGTAQLASNAYLKGNRSHSMKDNAWFVGFAPRQAPEIVVAALFENGEEGPLAAPIVRDVLKAYFDKKARMVSELNRQRPMSTARVHALRSLGLPAAGEAGL